MKNLDELRKRLKLVDQAVGLKVEVNPLAAPGLGYAGCTHIEIRIEPFSRELIELVHAAVGNAVPLIVDQVLHIANQRALEVRADALDEALRIADELADDRWQAAMATSPLLEPGREKENG